MDVNLVVKKKKKSKGRTQMYVNLLASLLLLLSGLFGRMRGRKESAISAFIHNPSKEYPVIVIILVFSIIFYLILWIIDLRKLKKSQ